MDKVFEEMKLYQENKMLGAERVFKYKKIKVGKNGLYEAPHSNDRGIYLYHLLYGEFGNESNKYEPFKKTYIIYPKCKTGIEVLEMKPSRTKDGKITFDGLSNVELKDACKMNGIKGYSKCYKLKLVKLLMKADCIEEPKKKKKIIIKKKKHNQ